jgi:hypothetical protein
MIEHDDPDRAAHIEYLRSLTPEQRLEKAFALSEATRQLLIDGIRARFPDSTEDEFRELMLALMLKRCEQEQRRYRAMGYV